MDPVRFDALVRSFTASGTRRRLLSVLAAVPLAGMQTLDDEDAADARHPVDRVRRRRAQKRRKRRNTRNKKKNSDSGSGNGNGNNNSNTGNDGNNDPNQNPGGSRPGPLGMSRDTPTQPTAVSHAATCVADGGFCCNDSQCCGGNCFNRTCSVPVSQCQDSPCVPPAKGCADDTCCGDPATSGCLGECCGPPAFACDPSGEGCLYDPQDNGQACCAHDECASGNCFNHVCAPLLRECQGTFCIGENRGCAGTNCCDDTSSFSCGDTCCIPPATFCCGSSCCAEGHMCCGNNCLPMPASCCGDWQDCGNSASNVCCGRICCQTGQVCCGNACCDADTPVCAGEICCDPGNIGNCGGTCCSSTMNSCCDTPSGLSCCFA